MGPQLIKITDVSKFQEAGLPWATLNQARWAFRKRHDPITLADIQVGDTVRADGAVKDGVFTATNVNVLGESGGETPQVPRTETPQAPQSAPTQ